ncbi:hypothetical protein OF83DRAFT_1168324 [Amylostereum chailletii]|nr:hypothetical protein OF83DRAFT_1168324 [Amylostereum chailletii]
MTDTRKTVLITGCTTGSIGHGLAAEFFRRGCRVFATTRNPSTMQDLVDHEGIETLQLDVCSPDSIRAAREKVAELTGGKLDYVVNNAGGGVNAQPALEIDTDLARATFDLNFFSVPRMVQEFSPLLFKSENAHIVNIGSVAGLIPVPYLSMYSAAKAALAAYSDTLRLEIAPFGRVAVNVVQVTTVITGGIKNSRDLDDDFTLNLTPQSLYRPVAEIWKKASKQTNTSPTETSVYAKNVVDEVLKSNPSWWFWSGSKTTIGWILHTFIPKRLLAFVLSKTYGFDKLAVQHREPKKFV